MTSNDLLGDDDTEFFKKGKLIAFTPLAGVQVFLRCFVHLSSVPCGLLYSLLTLLFFLYLWLMFAYYPFSLVVVMVEWPILGQTWMAYS